MWLRIGPTGRLQVQWTVGKVLTCHYRVLDCGKIPPINIHCHVQGVWGQMCRRHNQMLGMAVPAGWGGEASLCDIESSDCYRQVCVTWRVVTATGKFVWHGGQWLLQASLCDMEGSDCCYRQVCVTWRAVTATGKSLEKHIEEKVLQLTQKAIWKANNNNNNNNNSITNKWAETDDVLFQQSNYT